MQRWWWRSGAQTAWWLHLEVSRIHANLSTNVSNKRRGKMCLHTFGQLGPNMPLLRQSWKPCLSSFLLGETGINLQHKRNMFGWVYRAASRTWFSLGYGSRIRGKGGWGSVFYSCYLDMLLFLLLLPCSFNDLKLEHWWEACLGPRR